VRLMGFQARYQLGDRIQYVDVSTREVQSRLIPDRVLHVLREGNERFVSGRRLHRDLARQVDATSEGQHPMAVVLSCIDSRAPVEMLFDLGIGDVFSCRLAGNIVSREALGSMEFACKVAGAKLIMVLGHTSCGAVKAACDFVKTGAELPGHIGLMVEAILPAAKAEMGKVGDFVANTVRENARLVAQKIGTQSEIIKRLVQEGKVKIVHAVYDLDSGRVEFIALCLR